MRIKEKIEQSSSIIIAGHVNPDGDTVGAGLSLLLGLENKYPEKKIDLFYKILFQKIYLF